ncbi:hypothetical protein B0H63DRAFT_502898 [Podospora didyma]|uniref:Heterokaryon incompatibility domain-containing protein n=1 Tax=Podospora didyma TaxID=330526 RepID=A0AAE0N985_9PEZI|nr:hypothetical protein B0H63DRAFT_502898 [Podospora didyma]
MRVKPQLDFRRLRGWMATCKRTHVECILKGAGAFEEVLPVLDVLRLIDVENMCLVETRDVVPYIALSYVWGSVTSGFWLTTRNKTSMMRQGILSSPEYSPGLPPTICDAIILVKELRRKFLWVDSLCLIQNDEEDLQNGIDITIVREVQEDLWMGVYASVAQLLKNSAYETRAWTFREHVISRRILYFVEDKVFFQCRESIRLETCEDHPNAQFSHTHDFLSSAPPLGARMDFPILNYGSLLSSYTRRALTEQSDILRAMAGINRRIRRISLRFGYRMLEGIPTGAFDWFVLFVRFGLCRRDGFPSYSWAGWRGKVDFPLYDDTNEWLRLRTWIIWYPLLQFWTLALFFSLHYVESHVPSASVHDRAGVKCGDVFLDGFEESKLFDQEGLFEFILLSQSDSDLPQFLHLSTAVKDWKWYNVMLIEWKEGGIAERRGIGTIVKEAILPGASYEPGPVWKEIILG